MKNFSIVAAIVALVLTVAFIMRFTGVGAKIANMTERQTQSESSAPREANTLNRQQVRIAEPQVTVQSLTVAE